MARFYGKIGYGESTETSSGSGTYEDVITERKYYGEVIRNIKQLEPSDKVNADFSVNNSISIVADEYATEHFFNIKYAEWEGALWTVTSVEVRRPRLILEIGTVYNGPTAPIEEEPEP